MFDWKYLQRGLLRCQLGHGLSLTDLTRNLTVCFVVGVNLRVLGPTQQ